MSRHLNSVSVVVPILNEEEVLDEFYKRTKNVLSTAADFFEIICIDDGSTDNTLNILKKINSEDPRIKVISFSRNFGHAAALSAGLNEAEGEVVVMIDADLQDPPEILSEFFRKWSEGYDVVYGIRKNRKEWWGKRFSYWLFYRLFGVLSVLNMPLDAGDFSLLDRKIVNTIKSMPETNRFIRGLRAWAGFKQYGVQYERAMRAGGATKYSLIKLFRLAADGIFSFSKIPLRLATFFGFMVAGMALVSILIILYMRIFLGILPETGFSSTVILILFLGGIQLITIGILGEYIGRIYEEVKRRPNYVVREKIGFNKNA